MGNIYWGFLCGCRNEQRERRRGREKERKGGKEKKKKTLAVAGGLLEHACGVVFGRAAMPRGQIKE